MELLKTGDAPATTTGFLCSFHSSAWNCAGGAQGGEVTKEHCRDASNEGNEGGERAERAERAVGQLCPYLRLK